jgi:polyisoprenoid-binding protein YceI
MTRTSAAATPRRWLLPAGLLMLALGAAVAWFAWSTFLAGDPPSNASIDQAAGVVATQTPESTTTPPASAAAASAGESAASPSPEAAAGVEGTWSVDTSVGSFADYTSAWAGFRVNEVLGQGIGETTAIGRTPGVGGTLTIDGTRLTAAEIEVDLTQIVSDRPRRDDAIQDSLGTSEFPSATFVLTGPVDLGGVPADGETLAVEAAGELTIHGVTQSVVFPLEARLVGDTIVVVGSTAATFSDFGIEMPSAPIVVSVEDDGILELQLFFTRSA